MKQKLKFFEWSQNSPGGSFDVDNKITHIIIIQSKTYEDAEKKAFELGVYYNGSSEGIDCSCCGDRWYEGQEIELPERMGYFMTKEILIKNIHQYCNFIVDNYGWIKGNPDCRVYFDNGDIHEYYMEPTND